MLELAEACYADGTISAECAAAIGYTRASEALGGRSIYQWPCREYRDAAGKPWDWEEWLSACENLKDPRYKLPKGKEAGHE